MDRAHAKTRHDQLKAIRAPEEKAWREIGELLRPDDADFSSVQRDGVSAYDNIIDSTPLYALDSFVNGIFGQATNPANRWFSLTTPDDELNQWQPAKAWLYKVSTALGTSLQPHVSSFYPEATAWFADVGAFGLGAMYTEEMVGERRFMDRAIPLRELYLDTDAMGNYDTVHRQFMLKGRQLSQIYRYSHNVRDDADYTVVHCVARNPDWRPGKIGMAGMPWASFTYCEELRDWQQMRGYFENPYAIPIWSRLSGKVYPRGRGHVARADARTLQEQERIEMTAAAFAAEPPTLVHAETDILLSEIVPNALIRGGISDNGKELVRQLTRGSQVQFHVQKSEQKRNAIREAFYFSIMQLINRPQMTATEFAGFKAESLRLMGGNLVRIQTGGLAPVISRRYQMLLRAGALPPPPPEMVNQPLALDYLSPLAQAQKFDEGRAVLQFIGAAGQVAQIAGPQVLDKLDGDAAIDILHTAFGPPPAVLADPRRVEEIRQGRMQQQASQAGLEQAERQASIMAEVSHAEQARTLGRQRVEAGA